MDKKMFVKELRPGIFLMDEDHGATGYLVVGSERACMIDTMNAATDLGEAVRELTDKPVFVINTHGHPDHVFGNVFFDEVYLNPKDYELANSFLFNEGFTNICRENGYTVPGFKPVKEGDVFDLGGRTLTAYEFPGHTPGGIVLLLKEERLLFTGDGINHHLWMMLDGCPPMEEYVKSLDRIMFLENEADYLLHGHARSFDDISLMRCVRQGAMEIVRKETGNDPDYQWFGGTAKQHPYSLEDGKEYSQYENSVICYRP